MKSKILYLLFLPLLLSCAIHSGTISSTQLDGNVVFEDSVNGVCESKYYFGIGGVSQNSMIGTAKMILYKKRPLKKGESYVNFSVDIKREFYIIYFKQTVTVSADVVKNKELPSGKRYSSDFFNKQDVKIPKIVQHNLFKAGDQVMNNNFDEGKIIILIDSNTAMVKYKNGVKRPTNIKRLFNKERSYHGVHIGSKFKNKHTTGKVVAVGINKLIVKNSISGHRCIYYD